MAGTCQCQLWAVRAVLTPTEESVNFSPFLDSIWVGVQGVTVPLAVHTGPKGRPQFNCYLVFSYSQTFLGRNSGLWGTARLILQSYKVPCHVSARATKAICDRDRPVVLEHSGLLSPTAAKVQ